MRQLCELFGTSQMLFTLAAIDMKNVFLIFSKSLECFYIS